MGLYRNFVSQTRKPEGMLGKMMLKGMNSGHAKVADWGMDHLNKKGAEAILEIGCGGGRNAGELLKRYPGSHVNAVDYGELWILPCLFEPDGSAVLTTQNGHQLLLDEGFFEDVHVFGKTIPCIAPGGAELIRDLL